MSNPINNNFHHPYPLLPIVIEFSDEETSNADSEHSEMSVIYHGPVPLTPQPGLDNPHPSPQSVTLPLPHSSSQDDLTPPSKHLRKLERLKQRDIEEVKMMYEVEPRSPKKKFKNELD